MAQYDDALMAGLNAANGIIDKMIADTGRDSATEILKITAIETKIDASADPTREDMNFLAYMLSKACSFLMKTNS